MSRPQAGPRVTFISPENETGVGWSFFTPRPVIGRPRSDMKICYITWWKPVILKASPLGIRNEVSACKTTYDQVSKMLKLQKVSEINLRP